MLNKELLRGSSKQEQMKVEITIGFIDAEGGDVLLSGYTRDGEYPLGKASLLPYWGTPNHTLKTFMYDFNGYYTTFEAVEGVTVHVEGYPTTLVSPAQVDGDPYNLSGSEGETQYLTFTPPPTVIWIQKHSNRSRNRVLRRGSSLGGSRC